MRWDVPLDLITELKYLARRVFDVFTTFARKKASGIAVEIPRANAIFSLSLYYPRSQTKNNEYQDIVFLVLFF